MKYLYFLIAFLILVLLSTSSVSAASYYVSLSGSDSNNGSQFAPFKTFNKSMSVLGAGDTLYINGGTYTESLNVNKSGNAGAPITIRGVAGQNVVIDAEYQRLAPLNIPEGTSYVNVADVEVIRSTFECVYLGGTHINVNGIDANTCRKFGYRVKGSYITIENSQCRHCVPEPLGGVHTAGGWGACLKTAPYSHHLTIRNNHIFNNWGEGLIIGQAANSSAYGNLVHDNFSMNIYIGNAHDIDVYKNITYSTNPTYYRGGSPASCINASEELISPEWGARLGNIRVFNNIAYGCKMGMGYTYTEVPNNGCNNCLFAYNTLVNTGGIKVIAGTKNHVLFVNNIIKGGTKTFLGGDVVERNNLFSDPLFAVNPGLTSDTYRLSANSPAINSAEIIAGINDDYYGNSKGSNPDIGAMEFGGVVVTNSSDLNSDGKVDIFDFNILLGNFGKTGSNGFIPSDIDSNGKVDIFDFNLLLGNFGKI